MGRRMVRIGRGIARSLLLDYSEQGNYGRKVEYTAGFCCNRFIRLDDSLGLTGDLSLWYSTFIEGVDVTSKEDEFP